MQPSFLSALAIAVGLTDGAANIERQQEHGYAPKKKRSGCSVASAPPG